MEGRSERRARLPRVASVAFTACIFQLLAPSYAAESGWMCQIKGSCAYGGCIPDPAPQCPADDCNAVQSHFGGQVVQFDINSFSFSNGPALPPTVTTAADCCNLCRSRQGCNTWTFCPLKEGCKSDQKPCGADSLYSETATKGRMQRFGKYGACNGTTYPQFFCQLLYNPDTTSPVMYENGTKQDWTSGTLTRKTTAPIVGAPEPPFAFANSDAVQPLIQAAAPGYAVAPATPRLRSPAASPAAGNNSCLTSTDLSNLGVTPRAPGTATPLKGSVNVAIARYGGTVLVLDTNSRGQPATDSQECAANCAATPECNAWTFCTSNVEPLGCGQKGDCVTSATTDTTGNDLTKFGPGVKCTADGRFPPAMCSLKKLASPFDVKTMIMPGSTSNVSANYFSSGVFVAPSKLKLCPTGSVSTATAAGP